MRIAQYEGSDSPLIIPSLHLSISYYTQILQYFCQFLWLHIFESGFESCFRCLLLICLDDLECYELFCLFPASLPPSPDSGYSDDYSEEKLKFNSKLKCKLFHYLFFMQILYEVSNWFHEIHEYFGVFINSIHGQFLTTVTPHCGPTLSIHTPILPTTTASSSTPPCSFQLSYSHRHETR